jgi:hypothetical protein
MEAEQIVRDLARGIAGNTGCGDTPGEPIDDEHQWCVLCGESEWKPPYQRTPHDPQCPWLRAANWVQAHPE